jgi:hypothetical protein
VTAVKTSILARTALDLAERGYHVFPLLPREKRPITGRGFKDATRDERAILHWWDTTPEANIGIACGASGIVVWDIDTKAGADPEDVLAELDRAGAPLILTGEAPERDDGHPQSLAGVRGAQVYFRGDLSGTDALTIAGTEIRGRQHYVVAPPSIHPSGVEYAGELPPVDELPPIPDWLRAMRSNGNGNGRVAPPVAEMIASGARNNTLASMAGSMRRRGMGAEAIAAALKVENAARCTPPLPESEVEAIAASVSRYAPADPVAVPDHPPVRYTLQTDTKGNLKLPPPPALDDVAGLYAWATCAFALDPAHPITGGRREGLRGPEGHVVLYRAGAEPIRFEPVTRLNAPMRMIEALSWERLPSDRALPPYKGVHCQQIVHVVVMLCGAHETLTDSQETAGIVGTFMQGAVLADVKVTTYGGSGQRYEAATALRRPVDEASGRPLGAPRYAYDCNTGEMLIAVSDLTDAARRHIGSSIPHGWLDGRIATLGWQRITLAGYALPGRDGRKGPHARINAYRGLLPGDDDSVNT